MWARLSIYEQGWAKNGSSGWVRQRWVIYLADGCVCFSRSRDGYGQVWAYMGKGGQRGQVWMGQNDQAEGTYLAGGCRCACRSRGGCWRVWADMGKGVQR